MSPDLLTRRSWENYEFPPAFVLGFHGCDAKVGEAILRGKPAHLTASANDYDWLGHGIYIGKVIPPVPCSSLWSAPGAGAILKAPSPPLSCRAVSSI